MTRYSQRNECTVHFRKVEGAGVKTVMCRNRSSKLVIVRLDTLRSWLAFLPSGVVWDWLQMHGFIFKRHAFWQMNICHRTPGAALGFLATLPPLLSSRFLRPFLLSSALNVPFSVNVDKAATVHVGAH